MSAYIRNVVPKASISRGHEDDQCEAVVTIAFEYADGTRNVITIRAPVSINLEQDGFGDAENEALETASLVLGELGEEIRSLLKE